MKKLLYIKNKIPFNEKFEKIIVRLIASWCFLNTFSILYSPENIMNVEFSSSISTSFWFLFFAFAFVSLSVVAKIFKTFNTDAMFLLILVITYVFTCVIMASNIYLALGLLIPLALCLYYVIKRFEHLCLFKDLSNKFVKTNVIMLVLIILTIVGGLTTLKYFTFSSPNYDFGLFSQMFYYMKETFIPYCTSERDKLLSHFAIHISPVFYMILPVYMIFPSPATLQIFQAVLIASCTIPVYLLCKHYKLSNKVTFLVTIMMAFFPALSGGAFYDFHENAFLTPLILWMLYFSEKNKYISAYIFMLLTLTVKEDASIYIIFIALYFIFSGRKIKYGTIMLISAIAYFSVALYLLEKYGTGVMVNRFNNYYSLQDNKTLFMVIINVLKNPAYVIKECFNEEKLLFSLQMLLPLGFLPLMNKKWSQFILLGPFVLVNLMSNYVYQHSIYFQYVYGVIAIFFYLTIINITQIRTETKRYIVPMATAFSVVLFLSAIFPKTTYVHSAIKNKTDYEQIRASLELVPDDAKVVSSTFYLAHLSQRKEIYEVEYTKHDGDYLVLDLRYETGRKTMKGLDNTQYQLISYKEGLIAVYKNIS